MICLDEKPENLRKLPCGHFLDETCIKELLKRDSKCPACRRRYRNALPEHTGKDIPKKHPGSIQTIFSGIRDTVSGYISNFLKNDQGEANENVDEGVDGYIDAESDEYLDEGSNESSHAESDENVDDEFQGRIDDESTRQESVPRRPQAARNWLLQYFLNLLRYGTKHTPDDTNFGNTNQHILGELGFGTEQTADHTNFRNTDQKEADKNLNDESGENADEKLSMDINEEFNIENGEMENEPILQDFSLRSLLSPTN